MSRTYRKKNFDDVDVKKKSRKYKNKKRYNIITDDCNIEEYPYPYRRKIKK